MSAGVRDHLGTVGNHGGCPCLAFQNVGIEPDQLFKDGIARSIGEENEQRPGSFGFVGRSRQTLDQRVVEACRNGQRIGKSCNPAQVKLSNTVSMVAPRRRAAVIKGFSLRISVSESEVSCKPRCCSNPVFPPLLHITAFAQESEYHRICLH